jgi:hypothetical protein
MPEENPGDIYYRHATASGWTQTELVSTNSPRESSEPSLAVDSDGHVHIAWQDETRFETYFGTVGLPYRFNIYYRKYQPGSGWSQRVAITKNSLYAANPCVDTGPDDTVHIAWDEAHIVNNQVRHDVFYKYYTTIEINPLSYADPVRKTAIIVDPVNKLFQFTGSGRVYPVEEADMMLVWGDSITILDRSEDLLLTAQINTRTGLCIAIARDRQTGNVYWLIARPGTGTR